VLYTRDINNERETMNTTTLRYQAVTIRRIEAGNYTVNNIAGATISFKLLRDAHNFINANWGQALIEAQFAA
jgi:hypothetical protein